MRKVISIVLMLFIAVSIVYLAVGERGDAQVAPTEKGVMSDEVCEGGQQCGEEAKAGKDALSTDTVVVYYLHRTMRCRTCQALEAEARKAIESAFSEELAKGNLSVKSLNVEEAGNSHFIEQYQIAGPSLVLSKMNGASEVSWKNLDQIWNLIRTPDVYRQYVIDELNSFLKAKS